MGDELNVGGMVDGLDADNLGAQRRRLVFGMFDEFSLSICWSRNVYGSSISERLGRGARSQRSGYQGCKNSANVTCAGVRPGPCE